MGEEKVNLLTTLTVNLPYGRETPTEQQCHAISV